MIMTKTLTKYVVAGFTISKLKKRLYRCSIANWIRNILMENGHNGMRMDRKNMKDHTKTKNVTGNGQVGIRMDRKNMKDHTKTENRQGGIRMGRKNMKEHTKLHSEERWNKRNIKVNIPIIQDETTE